MNQDLTKNCESKFIKQSNISGSLNTDREQNSNIFEIKCTTSDYEESFDETFETSDSLRINRCFTPMPTIKVGPLKKTYLRSENLKHVFENSNCSFFDEEKEETKDNASILFDEMMHSMHEDTINGTQKTSKPKFEESGYELGENFDEE